MAHLWRFQNDQWHPVPLAGSVLGLSERGEPFPVELTGDVPIRLRAVSEGWVLLAAQAARIRVNGELMRLGCRVLGDRDEIVLGGAARIFFSTERLAHIEPFPGVDNAAVCCARCQQRIELATLAVRCPGCGAWVHEAGNLRCWTYTPTCPLCPQPTAADAGYRWEPGL
jgi:hypothetical protein